MPLVQAAVIVLIALILTPGYFFYFDITPKLVVLLIGAAACSLLWRGRIPARALTIASVCTVVSLAISAAASSNPALTVFGSTWRRFGLLTQLAILLFAWLVAGNGEQGKVTILRGIAAASAIASLYGIAQYFGWDPVLPRMGYYIGEGLWMIVRPPGTMGYVSYFATWLLMGGFLCLSLAMSEYTRFWRRLAYVCFALCFIAMLLTGTRAALLGAAAGIATGALRRGIRPPRRVLVAAAGVAFAAGAFYFSPFGWPLRSRTRWFLEDPWGGARPLLWRDSLHMALQKPLAGFGPEVFTATFPRFESKQLARAYPDFAHESPHNIFLDALVSQGFPGLACLGAFCALGIVAAWRAKRSWMLAALTGGIVAQQFTVFTIPTGLLFYVTVALCGSARQSPAAIRLRIARVAVAAAMLSCAIRYAAADRMLERTRQRIDAHDIAGANTAYQAYERRRLPGAAADLWHSRALVSVGAILPAGQAALAATRTAEDPFNAWYSLAEIYAVGNSAPETEACLRRASAANPNWFKPHWMLAELLRIEGRTNDAACEAAIAADLDGGKHPEVSRTLSTIQNVAK